MGTVTLTLTKGQRDTIEGALFVARCMVDVWSPEALDAGIRAFSGGRERRAAGETDASMRDRCLMLIDTALADEGPELPQDEASGTPNGHDNVQDPPEAA